MSSKPAFVVVDLRPTYGGRPRYSVQQLAVVDGYTFGFARGEVGRQSQFGNKAEALRAARMLAAAAGGTAIVELYRERANRPMLRPIEPVPVDAVAYAGRKKSERLDAALPASRPRDAAAIEAEESGQDYMTVAARLNMD
jgi:hypothetical protein